MTRCSGGEFQPGTASPAVDFLAIRAPRELIAVILILSRQFNHLSIIHDCQCIFQDLFSAQLVSYVADTEYLGTAMAHTQQHLNHPRVASDDRERLSQLN